MLASIRTAQSQNEALELPAEVSRQCPPCVLPSTAVPRRSRENKNDLLTLDPFNSLRRRLRGTHLPSPRLPRSPAKPAPILPRPLLPMVRPDPVLPGHRGGQHSVPGPSLPVRGGLRERAKGEEQQRSLRRSHVRRRQLLWSCGPPWEVLVGATSHLGRRLGLTLASRKQGAYLSLGPLQQEERRQRKLVLHRAQVRESHVPSAGGLEGRLLLRAAFVPIHRGELPRRLGLESAILQRSHMRSNQL